MNQTTPPPLIPSAGPGPIKGRPDRRFRLPRTVLALMLREMSTSYGRSAGGYLWAILEPVGAIVMLTAIFAGGLRLVSPPLGVSFPLYFATGYIVFSTYVRVQVKVAYALTYSKPLLFYPTVTFLDALIARFLLNLLTFVMVGYIVIGMIMLMSDTRAVIDFPPIAAAMTFAALLAFGVGCVNAHLFPNFPLWESLWGILTTPLFILSGIFFLYDEMPEFIRDILWFNPLIHVVGLMRTGFYPTYQASYVSPTYLVTIILVTTSVGLLLLRRFHKETLNL